MFHNRRRHRLHILLMNTDTRPIVDSANAGDAMAPLLGDDAGLSDVG
jgi:hypothetical protein